jgi:hypothetical protein
MTAERDAMVAQRQGRMSGAIPAAPDDGGMSALIAELRAQVPSAQAPGQPPMPAAATPMPKPAAPPAQPAPSAPSAPSAVPPAQVGAAPGAPPGAPPSPVGAAPGASAPSMPGAAPPEDPWAASRAGAAAQGPRWGQIPQPPGAPGEFMQMDGRELPGGEVVGRDDPRFGPRSPAGPDFDASKYPQEEREGMNWAGGSPDFDESTGMRRGMGPPPNPSEVMRSQIDRSMRRHGVGRKPGAPQAIVPESPTAL